MTQGNLLEPLEVQTKQSRCPHCGKYLKKDNGQDEIKFLKDKLAEREAEIKQLRKDLTREQVKSNALSARICGAESALKDPAKGRSW